MNHDSIVVPLVAVVLALPMTLVPMILVLRQVAKKREYQHTERMRALETGRPVPGESNAPQALVCVAIGAGVPVGAFLFTFLAWINSPSTPGEIWLAPAAVSIVAVLSTMKLATSLFVPVKHIATDAQMNGKPAFDPDAYDVVGSRG
jgi:hypothetical protein